MPCQMGRLLAKKVFLMIFFFFFLENKDVLLLQLHVLLLQCWRQRTIPHNMRDAKIFTLYKNEGDQGDCNNYRGISTAAGKMQEQRKPLFVTFVDLTKAFDTVSRKSLYKVLEKNGCPPILLQLIFSFF